MAQVNYLPSSPYYQTSTFGNFLDVMTDRPITKLPDDVLYEIDSVYQYRPDLLSADLYGTSSLWWVFAQRNMSIIKDPIYDFEPGVEIKIPQQNFLISYLGI